MKLRLIVTDFFLSFFLLTVFRGMIFEWGMKLRIYTPSDSRTSSGTAAKTIPDRLGHSQDMGWMLS